LHHTTARRVAGSLFVLFLFSSPVQARDRRPDPEAAAKEKEARDHYTQGMRHFDLGEIDEAVTEFKLAYQISAAPGLLFNIAQAYRTKKDYEQALQFYKNYLRLQPRAHNRADVEARVAEMEKMVEEQARMQKEKPVGVIPPAAHEGEEPEPVAPTPAPAEIVKASPPPAPRFLSTTGGKVTVALAVIAGVAAITGGALGGVALATRNDYHAGCQRGACDDNTYNRAHGTAIGADVLFGVTAAAAVGSLVVGLLTRSAIHKRAYARGAALVVTF
jgi:tetratricopeptide (TPR) repeat protein